MSDIKIVYEDEEWVEFELTQQNDLLGDTYHWDENDWMKWKDKMDRLDREGTRGQQEIIKVKLRKNPFIDGNNFGVTKDDKQIGTGSEE